MLANGVSKMNMKLTSETSKGSGSAAAADYSEQDKRIQRDGDIGQGERLAEAKRAAAAEAKRGARK